MIAERENNFCIFNNSQNVKHFTQNELKIRQEKL